MNKRRVVVTGLGVVSSIGVGKEEYWRALEAGTNGVGYIESFDTSEYPVKFASEIKNFDPERWMPRKEVRRADRCIQYATAAAAMAVEDAKLDVSAIDQEKFGVFVGTGQGGIDTCFQNFQALITEGYKKVSPFFIPMMISNMSAAYVAIQHGAKGPNMCVVTACASGTHSIGEAMYTIERGDADVMLAGGTEAGIQNICVAGFAVMKALSTRNDDPEHASRPFDVDRDGFVIGEGAGILVLEELEHAKARGAHIYAEVTGYGSTCDAGHITAPDAEGKGAVRAMRIAVEKSGWTTDQVDLINAHGTSTPLNDKMESLAINALFGDHTQEILVNSTKSMIGHALGAAGALETVAAIQSIEEGIVHKTLNCFNQDPECDVNVVKETVHGADVKRVLINNFGFGGHNGVVALQKYEG